MLRRTVQIGVVAGILALMLAGFSIAQQGTGAWRGGGRGNFDPAQFRQRLRERMKEQLGVTDDAEWKVLEPQLLKVMQLNQQALMGRFRGLFGMFAGGRAGAGGDNADGQAPLARGSGPNGEMTALDKANAQLRTTLVNPSSSPDDIKKALATVREAWAKVQQDRAAAQVDLKKILTLRQEAVLVEMGQLE